MLISSMQSNSCLISVPPPFKEADFLLQTHDGAQSNKKYILISAFEETIHSTIFRQRIDRGIIVMVK